MKKKGISAIIALCMMVTALQNVELTALAKGSEGQKGAAAVAAETSDVTPATGAATANPVTDGGVSVPTGGAVSDGGMVISSSLETPVVTSIKGGTKRVKMYWKKVTGADGYYIYYSTSANGEFEKIKTIDNQNTCKFVLTNLQQSMAYYFKISAYAKDTNGKITETNLSNVYSATTTSIAATSKVAKLYSTKAKFKKSPAYKKYSIIKKVSYTRCFAIPGMKNTNVAGFSSTTMVPQGAVTAGAYMLISAYDKTGADESVIYVVSKTAKTYLTTIVLPVRSKVNALAYDGTNIYLTQSKKVFYFPFSVVTSAVTAGTSFYELSDFSGSAAIETTGSYMTYYKKVLWVGNWKSSGTPKMYGYTLTKSSGKVTLTKKYSMSMPNRTRAIAIDSAGYMYVTRSAKTKTTTSGYMSQIRVYKPSFSTVSSSGSIKKNTVKKKTKFAPMAMGSCLYGKYIYNVFASAQYSGNYKVDRVLAIKRSKLQ